MDNVNRTLYIPLYGKAYVSGRGMILHDPKAEKIWAAEGFALKGKSKSRWLAYYMGMRSAVFDRWLGKQLQARPGAVVLHLGCGLDSRVERVGAMGHPWFDVDFPDVIGQRKRFYQETDNYKMLCADITGEDWLAQVPKGNAIVVMEGVSMYLRPEELKRVLGKLTAHFTEVSVLKDCYTEWAARASRYKNPINDVGVTRVYGLDDPGTLEDGTGLTYVGSHAMTPEELVDQLHGAERKIFRALYAGRIAEKLYRLYEYRGSGR